MAKKVIHVPVDPDLLVALDRLCKRLRKPRAELVRDACRRYLGHVDNEDLDKRYRDGYEAVPEEPAVGEVQTALTGRVLSRESW